MKEDFIKLLNELAEYKENGTPYYDRVAYSENIKKVLKLLVNKNSKGVVIYGDFDADGIVSATILHGYLNNIAKEIHPDREGDFSQIEFSSRQNSFGMTENEYERFAKQRDLIIPVDNGSDLPYLTLETNNIMPIDHHPTKNDFPYIINPNSKNTEKGTEYLTSGGKVVYEFIKNIDNNLAIIYPNYETNYELLRLCKELASITVISDMALMTKENREFVIDALMTIDADPSRLFIYGLLGDYTSRNFSFDWISKINAESRIDGNLHTVHKWIAPDNYEQWIECENTLEKNNTEKKALVTKYMGEYYSQKQANNQSPEDDEIILFINDKMPIGLNGLVANKLSSANANKPVIAISKNNAGDWVASCRGSGVKSILDSFMNLSIGTHGGHEEACGMKLKKGQLETFITKLHQSIENNPELVNYINKHEVVNMKPMLFEDFLSFQKTFTNMCEGVDYYKKIHVLVEDFSIDGYQEYKSQYATLMVSPKDGDAQFVNMLIDTNAIDLKKLSSDKNEEIALLMEFTTNKDFALKALVRKDEVDTYCKIMPEMETKGLSTTNKKSNKNTKMKRSA